MPKADTPETLGLLDLSMLSHRRYPYSGSLVKVGRFVEVFRNGKYLSTAVQRDSEWGDTVLAGESLGVSREEGTPVSKSL